MFITRLTGAEGREMKSGNYVPDRGDIVWLTFNPQAGHEQAGRRPALCLSPKKYNEKTSLGIFVPITSKAKGYPFEVPVKGKRISGVILSDQVRNLDWRVRKADFIEKCSPEVLEETMEKLKLILSIE